MPIQHLIQKPTLCCEYWQMLVLRFLSSLISEARSVMSLETGKKLCKPVIMCVLAVDFHTKQHSCTVVLLYIGPLRTWGVITINIKNASALLLAQPIMTNTTLKNKANG